MMQKAWRFLMILAVVAYLGLAFKHYLNQRPLWNDEACVYDSLPVLKPHEFFTNPLVGGQQFPRFYLMLIQAVSIPFDFHVLALRFWSFIAMIAGFGVWVMIARRCLPQEKERLLYVLSWLASIPLLYYASELKQYSMDVLAVGLFVLFLLHRPYVSTHKGFAYWLILLALPCLGLFSYPVFLCMAILAYNLLLAAWRKEGDWASVVFFIGMSALIAGFVYYCDIRVSGISNLKSYWQEYFVSFKSPDEFFKTFGEGLNNLFSRWFAEKPKWVRAVSRFFMAFAFIEICIGFFRDFKKDKGYIHSVRAIAFGLLIGQIVLAALQKYPLGVPRLSLFFAPLILLTAIEGMHGVGRLLPRGRAVLLTAYALFLLVVASGIAPVILGGTLAGQTELWQ